VLEGQLNKHDGNFILPGPTPTAVDLHMAPWIKQYSFAGLKMNDYPHTEKWLSNFMELKEVKAAYDKVPNGKEM
jgi:glutathione S-transferase